MSLQGVTSCVTLRSAQISVTVCAACCSFDAGGQGLCLLLRGGHCGHGLCRCAVDAARLKQCETAPIQSASLRCHGCLSGSRGEVHGCF